MSRYIQQFYLASYNSKALFQNKKMEAGEMDQPLRTGAALAEDSIPTQRDIAKNKGQESVLYGTLFPHSTTMFDG